MDKPPELNSLYDAEYFRGLPVRSQRISRIFRHIPFACGDRVCELGCGVGHVLLAAHRHIGYGLGIDFSEYAISQALLERNRCGISTLDFSVRDIAKLVTDVSLKESFDKVLMMDLTEHIHDQMLLEFLVSTRHILKQAGKLYIHTPNARYYLEIMKKHNFLVRQYPGHIAVRSADQYRDLLRRSGLRLESITYLPHYHGVLGKIDAVMMRLPLLGKLFQSRLLITVAKS